MNGQCMQKVDTTKTYRDASDNVVRASIRPNCIPRTMWRDRGFSPMLSKCLNPRCSATFQYFGQGRLFRVDFADVGRKCALTGKEVVPSVRSKACPVEHFWLCEACATTLTIALTDG